VIKALLPISRCWAAFSYFPNFSFNVSTSDNSIFLGRLPGWFMDENRCRLGGGRLRSSVVTVLLSLISGFDT
jgi:hypothetical protein